MQLDSVKIRNISIFILNDHTIMFMNSLQHPKKKVRLTGWTVFWIKYETVQSIGKHRENLPLMYN